eukprot:5802496-Pleurochrysis_carterae.AAC.1
MPLAPAALTPIVRSCDARLRPCASPPPPSRSQARGSESCRGAAGEPPPIGVGAGAPIGNQRRPKACSAASRGTTLGSSPATVSSTASRGAAPFAGESVAGRVCTRNPGPIPGQDPSKCSIASAHKAQHWRPNCRLARHRDELNLDRVARGRGERPSHRPLRREAHFA